MRAYRFTLAVLASAALAWGQQYVDIATPNSGTGDPIRTAFGKANTNTAEIYGWLRGTNAMPAGFWSTNATVRMPYPEAFGAVADDAIDDYSALTNCLATYNRVELGRGIYLTSNKIVMGHNQSILGMGKDITTLKLTDDSAYYTALPVGSSGAVIETSGGGWTNLLVKDLTVDSNLRGQAAGNFTNTMHGVALETWSARIVGVKAVGWGVGGQGAYYRESFPLILFDDDDGSDLLSYASDLRIQDCEVTGGTSYKATGNDFTAIVAMAHFGEGRIEGCWVHDAISTTNIPFGHIHALSVYGSGRILNNTVERFFGDGVYFDSWTNNGVLIEGNRFKDCWKGLWINGTSTKQFLNLTFRDNWFDNYDGDLNIEGFYSNPVGSANYLNARMVYVNGYPIVTNLVVQGNICVMDPVWYSGTTNYYGSGVYFEGTNATVETAWSDFTIANNVFSQRTETGAAVDSPILWYDNANYPTNKIRIIGNRGVSGLSANMAVLNTVPSTEFTVDDTMLLPVTWVNAGQFTGVRFLNTVDTGWEVTGTNLTLSLDTPITRDSEWTNAVVHPESGTNWFMKGDASAVSFKTGTLTVSNNVEVLGNLALSGTLDVDEFQVGLLQFEQSTLATVGATNFVADLIGAPYQLVSAATTNHVTFTHATNVAAGRWCVLLIDPTTNTTCGLRIPTTWFMRGFTSQVLTVTNGTMGMLSIYGYGADNTNVIATYDYATK